MIKFELHIPINSSENNLVETLLTASQPYASLSVGQIKAAINKGALWLSRGNATVRLRKVKKPLQPHDTLHFYYDEKVLNQVVEPAQVVYDFGSYSVLFKPYGMLSQGSKWSDHCTITRWAEQHLQPQRPAFLVHRLDRAASGLMIIAHSKKMASAFSKMFEKRLLRKTYHIICHGHYQHKGQRITHEVDQKPAISHFTALEYDKKRNISLVEVTIETGRKHQIRIHAAHQGFPIVGDRLHGYASEQCNVNLQLSAVRLVFCCPVTEQQKTVELPTELTPNLASVGHLI